MKNEESFSKKTLLEALEKSGLPYTMPNFVMKYEKMKCKVKFCPLKGKPFLVSPRIKLSFTYKKDDKKGKMMVRVYTKNQIEEIVAAAKAGWFEKHWHWSPKKDVNNT